MFFNQHDLIQINEAYLRALGHAECLDISIKLLKDLKEIHERLNQNPNNSSKPPSSTDPWVVAKFEDSEEEKDEELPPNEEASLKGAIVEEEVQSEAQGSEKKGGKELKGKNSDLKEKRKPGKQFGSPGYGRTQKLPITEEKAHKASQCAACGLELGEGAEFLPLTGHYIIDVKAGNEKEPGISVTNTKHIYGDTVCSCGHLTRTMPNRCGKDDKWNVELTEWHLVGPVLMSLICFLWLRMRLSRPRIQEFLKEWLGLHLCVGTINQCIHEAGRAAEPLEDQLIEELKKAELAYVDETSWKEHCKRYWLWVATSATVVYFFISTRSSKVIEDILQGYSGWLMTDGYLAYRIFKNRLRCWAHLVRKARGLKESLDYDGRIFGEKALDVLNTLIKAIYKARGGPGEDLVEKFKYFLEEFRELCKKYKDVDHEKTRALAREFLNDWEAIFLVLAHPELPLTNNEAERALRHWVIARRMNYGTRTPQGSRVFTILASVVETCRKRNVSTWEYLAKVISERRQGKQAPPIPAVSLA